VTTPLAALVVDQIMREHMDRANAYRRATPVRALRDERPNRTTRRRPRLGALVGRPAA
jgi:hypothetical protein